MPAFLDVDGLQWWKKMSHRCPDFLRDRFQDASSQGIKKAPSKTGCYRKKLFIFFVCFDILKLLHLIPCSSVFGTIYPFVIDWTRSQSE